jgi:phosphate starvation-inducible PhoH-like protein
MMSIGANIITIGDGPSGTGKTFVAAAMAADAFRDGHIERIYVTRPNVEVGNGWGFLPGELAEKSAPWFAPVLEVLEKRLGSGPVEYAMKTGKIDFKPLAFMRGWTFANAFVILDEAQNTTPAEMEMFLMRTGEDARVVIDGDFKRQKDIKGRSGLEDALSILNGLKSVGRVSFDIDDIVRSGMALQIARRYAERDERSQVDVTSDSAYANDNTHNAQGFNDHQPHFFDGYQAS